MRQPCGRVGTAVNEADLGTHGLVGENDVDPIPGIKSVMKS